MLVDERRFHAVRKLFVIIHLFVAMIVAAGCSTEAMQESGSSFITEIYARYPSLKEKKYEVETIKRIVDGDTFETESGEKVRLIGVNTPETTNGNSEQYGLEAKAFSQSRLQGKTVYLFRDTGSTDKYGRLLRYLFIESEPLMFNEALVAEGYANTMTVPPNVMYADSFVSLERKARSQNKGLWGEAKGASGSAASSGAGTGAATSGSPSCKAPSIKGNINAQREKIYHLPGGRYYEQTIAEEMFCTENEAVAAGFRKSAP
jgi:micrococcal nuclease